MTMMINNNNNNIFLLCFRRNGIEKRKEYKEKYIQKDTSKRDANRSRSHSRSRSRDRDSHSRYYMKYSPINKISSLISFFKSSFVIINFFSYCSYRKFLEERSYRIRYRDRSSERSHERRDRERSRDRNKSRSSERRDVTPHYIEPVHVPIYYGVSEI